MLHSVELMVLSASHQRCPHYANSWLKLTLYCPLLALQPLFYTRYYNFEKVQVPMQTTLPYVSVTIEEGGGFVFREVSTGQVAPSLLIQFL
jgi:hypothetical protein